ncbi:hypothetical protein L1887_54137 [Cichorium endivia]|nr:hypothetical protein L1887_54137 [Cichorium endivia]
MSALDPGWSSTEIASKVATSAESERPPSGQGHNAYGDGMDTKAHHLMTGLPLSLRCSSFACCADNEERETNKTRHAGASLNLTRRARLTTLSYCRTQKSVACQRSSARTAWPRFCTNSRQARLPLLSWARQPRRDASMRLFLFFSPYTRASEVFFTLPSLPE